MLKAKDNKAYLTVLGFAFVVLMLFVVGFMPVMASAQQDDLNTNDTQPITMSDTDPVDSDPDTTEDEIIPADEVGPVVPGGSPENGALENGTGAVNPNPSNPGNEGDEGDEGEEGDEGGEGETTPGDNGNSGSSSGSVSFGGGGGGSSSSSAGEVLGAATVSSESNCSFLRGHISSGKTNDSLEVAKLQFALRNKGGFSNLPITGKFDAQTIDAVKAFQTKHMNDVLKPWGYNKPTGVVYILTQKKINELMCGKQISLTTAQAKEIEDFSAIALEKTPSNG